MQLGSAMVQAVLIIPQWRQILNTYTNIPVKHTKNTNLTTPLVTTQLAKQFLVLTLLAVTLYIDTMVILDNTLDRGKNHGRCSSKGY
jgi:hypothetical protein